MKSQALKRYFFKPLEIALGLGIMLMLFRILFPVLHTYINWTVILAPLLIFAGILVVGFFLIFLITWINSSSTEL
ncbi:hypothetical protein BH11BAC2_BH11BAC2_05320 [soil metagenome]